MLIIRNSYDDMMRRSFTALKANRFDRLRLKQPVNGSCVLDRSRHNTISPLCFVFTTKAGKENKQNVEDALLSEVKDLDRACLSLRLHEKRSILSSLSKDHKDFDALSRELFILWNIQRENNWDMNTDTDVLDQENYIDPKAFDVILSDVDHELLIGEVSNRLGVVYLSSPPESLAGTVGSSVTHGILFGLNCRPMVNMIISSKVHKRPRNIIFLVDSGSPHIYLCEQAMVALGFTDHLPKSFDIVFKGKSYPANVSPKVLPDGRTGHFKDINLIGSSFLSKAGCIVLLDYHNNEMTLKFP